MSLRSSITLILLTGLVITLNLLAIIFWERTFDIFGYAPISIPLGDQIYPLYLGKFSVSLVIFLVMLLFIHIINDLYGLVITLTICLVLGGSVGLLWGFFQLFENPPIHLSLRTFALLASITPLGFGAISIIFNLVRKWIRDSSAVISLFVSHIVGMLILATLLATLTLYPQLKHGPWLSLSITFYAQWFILSVVLLPFFYLMKIPFRILVGKKLVMQTKENILKNKISSHGQKDFFESRQKKLKERLPHIDEEETD